MKCIMRICVSVILVVMAVGMISCPVSQRDIVLRVGFAPGESHPWNDALQLMAEELAEKSEGEITLEVFPGSSLGTSAEMFRDVRDGTLDMFVGDPSVGATFAPELNLFSLPFLFRDRNQWQSVLDGQLGQEYAELINDKIGVRILAYWGGSVRNVIAVEQPVTAVEDLNGFKLRLVPSDLKFKVWQTIGAQPVPVSFAETYNALSQGVVDGMENEYPSIFSAKFYEVAPYFTQTAHEITVRPLFMNDDRFESLSDEQKQILRAAVQNVTAYARNLEQQRSQEAIAAMKSQHGVTEYPINRDAIQARVTGVFQEFGREAQLSAFINKVQNTR